MIWNSITSLLSSTETTVSTETVVKTTENISSNATSGFSVTQCVAVVFAIIAFTAIIIAHMVFVSKKKTHERISDHDKEKAEVLKNLTPQTNQSLNVVISGNVTISQSSPQEQENNAEEPKEEEIQNP
ncbi:MAG: hypothetical protein K2M36_06005 [Clostridia bacterium]|nr:hypothetical protein [Clostridia bacterium]